MQIEQLQTPAFVVDLDRAQRNCDAMRSKAASSGVRFRPHVKTHKTIELGLMQHGGRVGPITVSTLAEAEVFAAAGFSDITYAVPIAPDKLARAEELARRVQRLSILVDSEAALHSVEQRFAIGKFPFDVFLKVDCGYHRAGVDPSHPDSVRLANALARSEAVRFQGLLTHAGHSYNALGVEDIRRIAAEEVASLTRFRALLGAGFEETVRSIGSTPTASVADRFTDVDEVRPGNYVFYDAFQATVGSCSLDDVAVSVIATVVGSYPDRGEAILDAGALAMSKDRGADHLESNPGFGLVCDMELRPLPYKLVALSQEHGKLKGEQPPPVGTRLRIVPNHSCLTAAMFDRYHIARDGHVVDEWRPVRGW